MNWVTSRRRSKPGGSAAAAGETVGPDAEASAAPHYIGATNVQPGRVLWPIVAGLITFNIITILNHELWLDELRAWRLVVESPSLSALYHNFRSEGHPALWYLLLWLPSRLTSNPVAMKLVHAAIASATYILIIWKAPLSPWEKVLLLLSYFLFFEYWIVSRNYAIAVLLAFLFVHHWASLPSANVRPWLLLGLMANANLYAGILAGALALGFVFDRRALLRRMLPGVAVFVLLCVVAAVSMTRAQPMAERWIAANSAPEESLKMLRVASWIIPRVFIPISAEFPGEFYNPSYPPLLRLIALGPLLVLLFMALRKEPDLLLLFSICLAGVAVFTYFIFSGSVRHWGIIFIAFVCCLWMLRARGHDPSWPASTLLAINAICGVAAAIAAQLVPFSHAESVARWIGAGTFSDALLIGVPESSASTVAGHLGKPFYFPGCDCYATYVQWSEDRRMSMAETAQAVTRILRREQPQRALLVVDLELRPEIEAAARTASLELTPLARFDGAVVENYIIYEVALESAGTGAPGSARQEGRRWAGGHVRTAGAVSAGAGPGLRRLRRRGWRPGGFGQSVLALPSDCRACDSR